MEGVKVRKGQAGQVLVEWVLLVAIAVVIFGSVFLVVRANLFSVWVCQYWPRVAAPNECKDEAACWEALKQGSRPEDVDRIQQIRDQYCDQ
ncbi:MAG TPA: hypothetical protein VM901_10885 [Bdellovibrionota bacterium]|nr:hypothetical protein [Bdellovibrionota bacterium]